MRLPELSLSRLFRHDWQIATNSVRATLSGWHDRVIAAILLFAVLAAWRSWLADRSWTSAAITMIGMGLIAGYSAGRLIRERLAFHDFDGLLAAEALQPPTRRRYITTWHSIGVAVTTALMLIGRPVLLVVGVAAYLLGALIAEAVPDLAIMQSGVNGKLSCRRTRALLRHPIAGIAAAFVLVLSLQLANAIGTIASAAFVGVETVLLGLALTGVDDRLVKFLTIAGHSCGRIIGYQARVLGSFAVVAVPGCWLALGPVTAGVVAAASTMVWLFQAMRILAYRLHGKRPADVLVQIHVGLLTLVAYATPIALLVVAPAVFWHLQRRAAAKTWLLE